MDISKFYEEMLSRGFKPGHIQADGKYHRFSMNGKPSDKAGWYIAHENPFLVVVYGDWRTGEKFIYSSRSRTTMSETERELLDTMVADAKETARKVKEEAQAQAAKKAEWLLKFKSQIADPEHPYIKMKGLKAPVGHVRQIGNALVIPVLSSSGKLATLQYIYPDGAKRFLKDGRTSGCFTPIKSDKPEILVCEGWATGVSLYEATGMNVACAFNAGNIEPVVDWLRKKNPDREIVICGDNDAWTKKPDGTAWNPGREKAFAAAYKLNVKIAIPEFQNLSTKPTDFNDLANLEGIGAVKSQVGAAKFPQDILLEELETDKGAAYKPEHLHGLIILKERDEAAYQSLRHKLKMRKVGIGNLEQAMSNGGGRGSKSTFGKNPKESEAAEIIAKDLKNQYAFDKASERWFRYAYGLWSLIYPQELRETFSKIISDHAEFPSSYNLPYFNGVIGLARNHLPLYESKKYAHLLPMKNGIFDPKSKELLPHEPQNGFKWQLPYAYDPQAECPHILAWLMETIGGSESLLRVLQAFLCAIIFGLVEVHRFLELIGPGGTGKSTFIWLAEQLIGAINTYVTELKVLEKSQFETASIYGKRLVLITDSERYAKGVSKLKALTGGDPLRYEEKNIQSKNPFYPEAMVAIAANEPIQSRDYTSGLQRRRLTVYFRHQIPLEKQRDLKAEFAPQITGLLNWVLELPPDEAIKILKSQDSKEQRADFKENLVATNSLAEWLHENTIYELKAETKTHIGIANRRKDDTDMNFYEAQDEKLYPNYAKFCDDRGYHRVALLRFRALLSDLVQNQLHLNKIKHDKDKFGRYFTNIRLRSGYDADENAYSPLTAAIDYVEGEI